MSDPTNPPKGRFIFRLRPKKFYLGDPQQGIAPVTPRDLEPVWDEDNNCIVVAKQQEDGTFKFIDSTLTLLEKINTLEQSGIFEKVQAFSYNSKVYHVFYDTVRKTIRLNPELKFPDFYRYYSVRKIGINPNGTYSYLSGFIDSVNGSILSLSIGKYEVYA